MLSPINFNNKFYIKTRKVGDKAVNRVLTPEAHTELALADGLPELAFGVCHCGPEVAGVLNLRFLDAVHSTPIPTFPLPGGRSFM